MLQSENELIDFMKPSSKAERESPIFVKRTKIIKKPEEETPTNLFIKKRITNEKLNDSDDDSDNKNKSNDSKNRSNNEDIDEKPRISNRLNDSRESSFTMLRI